MNRRLVLLTAAAAVSVGLVAPALATDVPSLPTVPSGGGSTNTVCIVTSKSTDPNAHHDGVCVWVPLPVTQGQ
ncbi:MAG: hypothetical protein WCD35_10545 [Mycobacteriales bacterium]